MAFPFKIVEHIIPGQHIREDPHALKGRQEAAVKLAIKQYIPLDQTEPVPENAVTIHRGTWKWISQGEPILCQHFPLKLSESR